MPTLVQQPEQKHVKITSKRQFTIPQKYYKELELIANLYLNEKLEKEYRLEKMF